MRQFGDKNRVCPECGGSFFARHGNQRFCVEGHRLAWQRRLAATKRRPKVVKAPRQIKGLTESASTTVAARIHRDDYEALRKRADAEQITPGEFVRRALERELQKEPSS